MPAMRLSPASEPSAMPNPVFTMRQQDPTPRARSGLAGLLLALALVIPTAQAAPPISAELQKPGVAAQLRALPVKAQAKLRAVPLDDARQPSIDLNLEKFDVFTPDARVHVHDKNGVTLVAPPRTAYYRGGIDGKPGSRVFWAVSENGEMRGVMHVDGEIHVHKSQEGGPGRSATSRTRKVDRTADFAERTFQCGQSSLPDVSLDIGPRASELRQILSETPPPALADTTPYVAHIAVETDYEFYQKFNNTSAATEYAGDLIAHADALYKNEINVNLQISNLYIYATSADPWTATASTLAALQELRNYWNSNRTGIARTVTHLMSGKALGGGIAYLDVLCHSHGYPTSGYGYGVSASLQGNFDPDNPQVVWDTKVVAHELGHNFGSEHSHYYDGIGGVTQPVDCCASDASDSYCGSGPFSLPGLNSLTGGTSGAANGTIMSYCHQRSGGYGNIAWTFGLNHNYGIAAYRVPNRMRAEVDVAAASYPTCFSAPLASEYPLAVSKGGDGTGLVSSSPAGIHCGLDCTETYTAGTSVTLTATADSGSLFAGWSGGCSGTASTCMLGMTASRNVTALFNNATDTFPSAGSMPAGWTTNPPGSNAPWTVATDSTHSGAYSLKSGVISHSQQSTLTHTATFNSGTVSFARRVSSESSWDFLRFYIDGVQQGSWSGEVGWSVVSYPISAGTHELKWEYKKDDSVSSGSDAAWIDSYSASCSAANDINLTDANISATNSIEACDTVTLGPNLTVSPTGNLGVIAGTRATLQTGTRIEAGGKLSVKIR